MWQVFKDMVGLLLTLIVTLMCGMAIVILFMSGVVKLTGG